MITRLKVAEAIGVELKYRRLRRLPNGRVIEVEGGVTYGDIEVWSELKLLEGVDALLGVTTLEKPGFKVDPKNREARECRTLPTLTPCTKL